MHCYSCLRSPAGKKFGCLVVDEIQDAVNPHPERVHIWTKFFDIAVTAPQQRILLTATFPPHLDTWDKNTFVTRTKSEFANRPVLHKSTNTIWSTGQLANSEFVLVANVLLSHV